MEEDEFKRRSAALKRKLIESCKEVQLINDKGRTALKDKEQLHIFRGMFKVIEKYYSRFENLWDELTDLYDSEGQSSKFPTEDDTLLQAKAKRYYYEALTNYEIIESETIVPSRRSINPNETFTGLETRSNKNLPRINLPHFNGQITNWPKFRDAFTSIIHNDALLSKMEKFHYLVSSLVGTASAVISNLPLIEDNYDLAWKALNDTFDNKRMLASNYLNQLLGFKAQQGKATVDSLQSFLSQVTDNIAAFKLLKIPDEGDFILFHISIRLLDPVTREHFELQNKGKDFPVINDLTKFLRERCLALQLASGNTQLGSEGKATNFGRNSSQKPMGSRSLKTSLLSSTSPKPLDKRDVTGTLCCICHGDSHPLFKCNKFTESSIDDRLTMLKSWRGCRNCLSYGHTTNKCNSKWNCKVCKKRHNSLLHIPNPHNSTASPAVKTDDTPKQSLLSNTLPSTLTATIPEQSQVLLGTVVAEIQDALGRFKPLRLVVDSGSQHSFITRKCLIKLGLKTRPCSQKISAIGQTAFDGIKGKVVCCLKPRNSHSPLLETEALIVNDITSHLPNITMPFAIWKEYTKFELADPKFWQQGPVDFLLGSDLFPDIWNGSSVTIDNQQPKLLSSIFGYIVIGRVTGSETLSCRPSGNSTSFFTVVEEEHDLRKQLQRFWELEDPPTNNSKIDPEDEACEKHFQDTHSRLENGQYMVRLPFKESTDQLDNLGASSLKRFYSLERKLNMKPCLKSEYLKFMKEYLDLGHMHPTTAPSKYIIPHHSVTKEDRSQIKLRVVFDASSHCPPSASLNSQLLGGPKLQQDIRDILIRFRMHQVVFVADIVKMYRQIQIHPQDRSFQHIFWRFDPAHSITKYELCTVTYGLTSAPFLALRVIKQLVFDEGENYPMAAGVILRDMYVDDIVTGASSLNEALKLQEETIDLLEKGHFSLSKWASNHPDLLHVTKQDHHTEYVNFSSDDMSVKILGLHWDPLSDVFMYKLQPVSPIFTKRSILSIIAKVYDPLGFLAPLMFTAKCLIQDLWKHGLDWDAEIDANLKSVWEKFIKKLDTLSQLEIPRCVIPPNPHHYQLIGFSDASAQGYCATFYLRVISADLITSHLIIAKTKLAPIKPLSIPRLELCGAHLMAKLYSSLSRVFSNFSTIPFKKPVFFTDASVVLNWLNTPPYKLKIFISNRVSHITELTPISCWRHVSSKDNPSDHGSRGLTADNLVNCPLWWNGPSWLCRPEEKWPKSSVDLTQETLPELKIKHHSLMVTNSEPFITSVISSQSNYLKTLNIIGWIKRFVSNLTAKLKKRDVCSGPLKLWEINEALTYVITQLQSYYIVEKECVSSSVKESIVRKKYPKLSPFIDTKGVVRVGGRLNRSTAPSWQKHPILLPKCHFTTLLIDYYHKTYLHPGPGQLQGLLQLKYWIPSLRNLVRHRTFKCLTCFKSKAEQFSPKMADLPPSRVTINRAFLHVGMDFAGPLPMRDSLRRKAAVSKAYICLFVCMSTKAVHLELVTALSTDAFMAAFSRFIARRGLPEQCYSDCGTNFQGAANKLRDFGYWYQQETTQNEILYQLKKLEIKWNFNPPHSPHFGGLWEAAVKSTKSILRRVAGETPLTYEELATWLARIEAVLNSRPLCPLSSSPEEIDFLSPGHFLIGSTLLEPPEPSFKDSKITALSRWQLLQKMTQHFWQRWRVEYLTTLQKRTKWTKNKENPKVGDLVLLKEPNLPVMQWPLARIVKVHPGEDGVVRVMTIKCRNAELKRPAVKLVPLLPLQTNHFD